MTDEQRSAFYTPMDKSEMALNRAIQNQEKILEKVNEIENSSLEVKTKITLVQETLTRVVTVLHGNGKKGIVERMALLEKEITGINDTSKTEEQRNYEIRMMRWRILIGAVIGAVGFAMGLLIKTFLSL